ncbi:hypothetical protein B566_EDAN014048 [Ephemera danica]|nr:hypothetical protein B566_EDAN014048 [Ephemera danica]
MDQTSMENQSWDEELEQSCVTSEDERGNKSSRKESSTRNKRNPKSYYQNKKLREQGAAYLGRSKVDGVGTITYVAKGERKMKPPCISNFCTKSKKRFCNEFTEEDRLLNFNKFWNQTWEEKKADIMSLVVKTNPKQSRIHSSRTTTLKYFLYRKDGLRYAVCQKFFCNTLSIVNTTVVRWIESEQSQVKRNTKAQHSTKEASVTSEERRIPEEQKMNANQADNISQFSQSQAVSTMERATHFMHQFCR